MGPVGRDGRLAPHRDGAPALARAPSRVPRALQRAKNGERATEARLGVASDAPIENRAGAAFAHGDAGAARHVRDDRRRRYVGARAEPCARSNRANPPRTRRGPRGRAPHTSIIRSKTSVCLCEKSRSAVSDIARVSTSIPGFRETRDCACAAETLETRLEKSKIARKGISAVAFFAIAQNLENRPTPVCRLVKWLFFCGARFLVSRARVFFHPHPRSGAAADRG